jgi:hypothetical protein
MEHEISAMRVKYSVTYLKQMLTHKIYGGKALSSGI